MRFIVIGIAAMLAFAGLAAAQNNLVTIHAEGNVSADANVYCSGGTPTVDTTSARGHERSLLGDLLFNGVSEDYGDCGPVVNLVIGLVSITGGILGSLYDPLDIVYHCTPDLDDLGNPDHDCTGAGAEIDALLPY